MTINISSEVIDPARAEAYLALNTNNRALNQERVLTLAEQMEAGRWVPNGDTIKFSTEGVLLDGQHRLAAIILAGSTLELAIARGLPEEAFETIDTNRKRSASDALALSGVVGYGSTALAAGAGHLWRMFAGARMKETVPNNYIIDVVRRFPSLTAYYKRLDQTGRTAKRLCPASALLPALVYLDEIAKRPDLADRLFNGLQTGEGLQVGDPILALRNRLLSNQLARNTLNGAPAVWNSVIRVVDMLESGESATRVELTPSQAKLRQPRLFNEHLRKLPKEKRLTDMPCNNSVRNVETAYRLVRRLQPANLRRGPESEAA